MFAQRISARREKDHQRIASGRMRTKFFQPGSQAGVPERNLAGIGMHQPQQLIRIDIIAELPPLGSEPGGRWRIFFVGILRAQRIRSIPGAKKSARVHPQKKRFADPRSANGSPRP